MAGTQYRPEGKLQPAFQIKDSFYCFVKTKQWCSWLMLTSLQTPQAHAGVFYTLYKLLITQPLAFLLANQGGEYTHLAALFVSSMLLYFRPPGSAALFVT